MYTIVKLRNLIRMNLKTGPVCYVVKKKNVCHKYVSASFTDKLIQNIVLACALVIYKSLASIYIDKTDVIVTWNVFLLQLTGDFRLSCSSSRAKSRRPWVVLRNNVERGLIREEALISESIWACWRLFELNHATDSCRITNNIAWWITCLWHSLYRSLKFQLWQKLLQINWV